MSNPEQFTLAALLERRRPYILKDAYFKLFSEILMDPTCYTVEKRNGWNSETGNYDCFFLEFHLSGSIASPLVSLYDLAQQISAFWQAHMQENWDCPTIGRDSAKFDRVIISFKEKQ